MTSSLKTFWRHKKSYYSSISTLNKSEKNMSYFGLKREKKRMEKSGKQSKLKTGKRKMLNGHRYKEFLSSQARNAKMSDLMVERRGMLSKGSGHITDTNCSNQVDLREFQSSSSCSKRQRVDLDSEQGCISHDLHGASLPAKERELEPGFNLENVDENAHEMDCLKSQPVMQIESQYTECTICLRGGKLLCCDGQGCSRSFHLSCVNPPLTCFPPGAWHCIWCIKKVIHYGVHSVSEGIESILDSREVVSDDEVMQCQKQYLVKYKGLAHVHSLWIPESQLLHEAPILLARYKKNKMKWKTDWSVPHRLIQKRLLIFPEPDDHFQGHGGNYSDCHYTWLVKWTGLSYNHVTWELENASFLKTPEAMKLMSDYESRHQKSKRASHLLKEMEGRKLDCSELSEFPFGISQRERNCHLSYVNKLRGYLYRGQNAFVFDDKERVVKVVLFILSLLDDDMRKPFLIITPPNALSLWEAEFSHWASSANIVVYNGNKDVRASIRALEFYNKGGSMMIQILLSPPDVVDEDLEILELIKWEAIIIDECQRRQISMHLKQIKKLAVDMRLLLVSCQVKDRRFNYQDVLLLLDPKFDAIDEDSSETYPSLDISKLKERLAKFVAFECKSGTSEFAEYWVPVHLSDVQVEQYCAQLLSNSASLFSGLKNDSVDSLRDLLLLNRKCCDHPYLVDENLQNSLTSGLPLVDHLDVGINVSGKLQLLEKILLEIKMRRLRVLLLFQSLGGSGPISIGDILDDFIHNRFGKDSYARIDGEIVHSKKQAALNVFNNKDSGNFVCLIDNRACLPRIKLSSVDIVVIFDSDWNPVNDLRALQKITINSQFEQLKVFRLYSPCTVEEKVLILAKQGATLDSSIQNIYWSTCHKLLKWGAYRLFSRLDDSRGYRNTLLNDVFHELLALLPNNSENGDPSNCSIISSVKENDGTYPRNISLFGENEARSMDNLPMMEQLDKKPSPVFWTNLLEGRPLMEKHLSGPSQRSRRKAKRFDGLLENPEFKGDCFENKQRKTLNRGLVSPPRRLRNRRKVRPRIEEREPAEVTQHTGAATNIIGETPSEGSLPRLPSQILQALRISLPTYQLSIATDIFPDSENNGTVQSSLVTAEVHESACLDPIMERIQKGKEEAIKNHEERKLKLISECDREIAEIRKKYDGLLQEAELALVEQKKDLETFYDQVYQHKVLAEAMVAQEKSLEMQQDVISMFMNEIIQQYLPQIAMKEQLTEKLQMTGGPPVQVVNHRHSSSVQLTAAMNALITEQSLPIPPVAGSPHVTPPVPLGTHSSAFQQTAAPPELGLIRSSEMQKTAAGYASTLEPSPRFPSTSAPFTQPLQLVSPSSLQANYLPRPLTIPTIHGSGRPSAISSIRAPAPHLRRARPPFASPQTNQPPLI